MELALTTGIPASVWLAEPDDILATVVDIYERRAAKR